MLRDLCKRARSQESNFPVVIQLPAGVVVRCERLGAADAATAARAVGNGGGHGDVYTRPACPQNTLQSLQESPKVVTLQSTGHSDVQTRIANRYYVDMSKAASRSRVKFRRKTSA